jgi:iron complex outermembrane receptor protein
VALTNVTVLAPLGPSLEFTASLHNLFNVSYSDPASEQHWEDAIPQNGRTFRVSLTWKYADR